MTKPTSEQHRVVEFRCPECGHQDSTTNPKGAVVCGNCDTRWKRGEHWKCHVLVRRFVTKLDYDYYTGL